MARTSVTVSEVINGGVSFGVSQTVDATNGMTLANTGNEVVFVKNADTVSHTVTVTYVADEYGRGGSDVITVSAGTTLAIGTFNIELYGTNTALDFDTSTGMTIGATKA